MRRHITGAALAAALLSACHPTGYNLPQLAAGARMEAALPPSPSTGGQVPVNSQAHDAMFFESAGVNPFVDTDEDALCTFGLDVDTASYAICRALLSEGTMPPRDAVRVEEFLNYFDWPDAPPASGEVFAIHVSGAPTPFSGESRQLLRVALRSEVVDEANRPDALLTFVIDVSGSMDMDNRLGLVKQALTLLVDQLRPTDQIAIVVYGDEGRVLMHHKPVSERRDILRAINRLRPDGSTNAEEGLVLGYEEARAARREGAINRVILCSDGVANVGETGPGAILESIGEAAREGITLTTVGFGMDNYNDVLMEQLADRGDGVCLYVDTLAEARRAFVENVTGTLLTVARDARAQIEFDPAVVRSYRLLGYENRDIADEQFRDDKVDGGEIGAGHRVTALVELRLWDTAPAGQDLGAVHLRWLDPDTGQPTEITEPIRRSDFAASFEAAPPALRMGACVAALAEVLRGSYWARDLDLDTVLPQAQSALQAMGTGDSDLVEFVSLLATARDLQNRGVEPGTQG